MTLFPLVMGALLLGALMGNMIILRQESERPEEVDRDQKRGLCTFSIMAALFFLSLLIPVEATAQNYVELYLPQFEAILPQPLQNFPFRILSWWFIIALVLIFGGLTEFIQERHAHDSKNEISSSKDWRKILTKKSRTISDSVYGLALGLCAYSLTDYVLAGTEDIILALSYFLLTFVFVFFFWAELFRCFGLVPFFDDALVATNLVLTFFVTLMPFPLRLAMESDIAARNVGMTLFPPNMIAAGLSSSAFIVIALRRRTVEVPRDDLMELQRFAVFAPVLAVIYVASLWIQPDATNPPQLVSFIPEPLDVLKTLPFRVLVWWFSLIPAFLVMGAAEIIQETMARKG